MIAKLVTSGASRPEAIGRMREALDAFEIRGVGNNVGFLAALVGLPRFAAGELSTNFIAEEFPAGFAGAALPEETRSRLLAIAAVVQHRTEARAAGRASAQGAGDWVVVVGGRTPPGARHAGSGRRPRRRPRRHGAPGRARLEPGQVRRLGSTWMALP